MLKEFLILKEKKRVERKNLLMATSPRSVSATVGLLHYTSIHELGVTFNIHINVIRTNSTCSDYVDVNAEGCLRHFARHPSKFDTFLLS